jgi:hypothetical protein
MAEALKNSIAFVGIDIGKNSFHVVGLDGRGAIAAAEVVARPGGSSVREYATMSDRHGSLRRRSSSQPRAPEAWP